MVMTTGTFWREHRHRRTIRVARRVFGSTAGIDESGTFAGWPLGCTAGPPLRPDRSGLQRGLLLLIQPTPPHLPLAVGLAPRIPPETLEHQSSTDHQLKISILKADRAGFVLGRK